MPKQNLPNPLDDFNLDDADDLGPKCACILLLDVSGSMSGERIDALNDGLVFFQQDLDKRDLVKHRVDVAVITFGSEVTVAQDFIPAADFEAATLTASGATRMGGAIEKALDMLEERKEFYRLRGNPVYRPWIFLITDGSPTDDGVWQSAANRVREAEKKKAVIFWAIGVEGADQSTLAQISARIPWKLKGLQFGELFLWLSNSLGKVSSSTPGEAVALDKPTSDFVID